MTDYDVVIVGAGLSGLTTAYCLKRLQPHMSVCILERSGSAGGLTGNWIDHRWGSGKKLQMPMHMIFRDKYPNLVRMVDEVGGLLTPIKTGYTIITSDRRRHRLEMNDWTAKRLPPPLHGLGMFAKLDLPLASKWDLLKLACASAYCSESTLAAQESGQALQEPPMVPNTLSFEGLQLLLGMGARARDFVESVTPSIFNLHPWYTSGPRMANVIAGTLVANRNSLHHHVFAKSYNAAYVDKLVARLTELGVEFKFWSEARRLECDATGKRVSGLWYQPGGPHASGALRSICDNCGAENYLSDRAFCTRCGLDTTLDRIRDGGLQKAVGSELWRDPERTGARRLTMQYLVTAMYPHMIARLLPEGSALRNQRYVRSFFSSRARQTELAIARVYYRTQVTRGETEITGTHNPTYVFNGCQSVYNNFGSDDLSWQGDVVDVLLDVGVLQQAWSRDVYVQRILEDLHEVYPDARPKLAEHVAFAKIQPDVLYLSEQPAIAGQQRIFNTQRTETANWYVAGCHSGLIGIGMESATQSGMAAANCLLEDAGYGERAEILPYQVHAGSKLAAAAGRCLLRLKGGRHFARMHKL